MSAVIRQNPVSCPGHTRPVVDLEFSGLTECGYFFITASKDGMPMLRKGDTGDWIGNFEGHKGAVWCCTLTPDGKRAATGAADFVAKVWNAENGEEITSITHDHIVRTVNFSKSGERLLTASNKKIIRVFDLNRPDEATHTLSGHTGIIRRSLWIDDDRRVVSVAEDKTMRVWDLASGEVVSTVDFPTSPFDLELDPTQERGILASGRSVSMWSVRGAALEKTAEFEMPCDIYSASLHPKAFSKDGTDVFVCGGNDFIMYKCDANSGLEMEASKAHFGPIHTVRFAPDGRMFASGSEDGTVRLWQTTAGETYGLWKLVQPGEELEK